MSEGLFTGPHNVRRAIRPVNMRRTRAFGAELTSSSAITQHTHVKLSAQTCSSCSDALLKPRIHIMPRTACTLAARHYFID